MRDVRLIPNYPCDGLWLVAGREFREVILGEIERARSQLFASFFLISLLAAEERGTVRSILDAFVRARRRYVDVRVIVDDFVLGPNRARANAAACGYLTENDVAVRVFEGGRGRASHSKYLLRDERYAVVGSGNLTPGGLDRNSELALRVDSTDFTRDLSQRFLEGWQICRAWGHVQ
ncbi:MAG: phospholipase D family protein [Thermoleophilia bacterium]